MADEEDWDFYEDYIPDDTVTCDRCDGDGEIEEGDDVIYELVGCPVCHGEGYISKELWEKRAEAHRKLMKAIWGDKATK